MMSKRHGSENALAEVVSKTQRKDTKKTMTAVLAISLGDNRPHVLPPLLTMLRFNTACYLYWNARCILGSTTARGASSLSACAEATSLNIPTIRSK